MKPIVSGVALAALLSLIQPAQAAESKKPLPHLAGEWSLERDHSQLPPERPGKEGEAGKPEGPPGDRPEPPRGPMGGDGMGGMGGGMGRRGGMGGMGMGGPGRGGFQRLSPEQMAAMRAVMQSALKPATTVRLQDDEGALVVTSEEHGTLILRPDGKKVKLDGGGERRTRWNEDQLEEEIKVGSVKVKRIYGLTDTERGRRLVIVVRIEDERRGEREYWYVYQPVADPKPETAPSTPPPSQPL
jgi:hypothetical protein